jgi:hypothetical protein
MSGNPLQYSNQPAYEGIIWESTDESTTLIFPHRAIGFTSLANHLAAPVLGAAAILYFLIRGSYSVSLASCLVTVFLTMHSIKYLIARQPNRVHILDGVIRVDSALADAVRQRHRRMEKMLEMHLEVDLSHIYDVRAVSTGFNFRGHLIGKLIISTKRKRTIAVGTDRNMRELQLAAKKLREAMFDAGWRPPQTLLTRLGRWIGQRSRRSPKR